jgi:hypothetical protein
MYAVIGRVRIHPGHEDETKAMITNGGVPMVRAMSGATHGYWTRTTDEGGLVQHSFWLFDTLDNAEAAAEVFGSLRGMPEAPATFLSVDVGEVVGET